MKSFGCCILIAGFYACSGNPHCEKDVIKIDNLFLDSIRKSSDTNYTKKYRNQDFVKADYYLNRKNGIVCQVMKDSLDHVRQIIIGKKNIRIYTAQYYPNGQLMARLPLDDMGKYDGLATNYFENGCIKSRGYYKHGFYYGEWKNYDPNGHMVSVDGYDSTGQLIKSEKR